jgi:hypothetical protein
LFQHEYTIIFRIRLSTLFRRWRMRKTKHFLLRY